MELSPRIVEAIEHFLPDHDDPTLEPQDAVDAAVHALVEQRSLPPWLAELFRRFGGRSLWRTPEAEVHPHPWGSHVQIEAFMGPRLANEMLDVLDYRLPRGLFPIAADPGGNLLLVTADQAGPVYFWDHEHREVGGRMRSILDDLAARGIDTRSLDLAQAILKFHRLNPGALRSRPGWSNLYEVASSLEELLSRMVPTAEAPTEDEISRLRAIQRTW